MEVLLRRFPGLRGFPRIDLGVHPTPVEERTIGGVRVLVKRDDSCCDRCGGNKARAMEFLLTGAPKRLLTFSTLSAHHAYATAFFGWERNLETDVVIVKRGVRGRRIAVLPGFARRVIEVSHEFFLPFAAARLWRPGTRIIPPGGMSARGALGYVVATFELEEIPPRIYVPLGTGTTVSGLLAGLMLRDAETEVVAVQVSTPLVGWPPLLWRRAFRAVALLRKYDPSIPDVKRGKVKLRVVRGGGRYGELTPVTEAALEAARPLVLEGTYTGKTLALLLNEGVDGSMLVNTYGGPLKD